MSSYPPLKPGDEIRVIAPSFSQSLRKNQRHAVRAKERLESLGYKVTVGKYLQSRFHLGTAKAQDRAKDFNDAIADNKVKAVMAFTGGWSANELLPLIDWQLLKNNPKPLCGFSDITVLLNAIYAKTGIVGFLGPNFSTLGRMTSWQYTLNNFNTMLKQELPHGLKRSQWWAVKSSSPKKTKPWKVLQPGQAEGIMLGGNLGTFYLLQGTEYQPKFNRPFILLAEDDDESGKLTPREVSRRLESILQLPGIRQNMKGLLIGRFKPESHMSPADLSSIIQSKNLGDIPVISNVDFGHTAPMVTLPIGGTLRLDTSRTPTLVQIEKL